MTNNKSGDITGKPKVGKLYSLRPPHSSGNLGSKGNSGSKSNSTGNKGGKRK